MIATYVTDTSIGITFGVVKTDDVWVQNTTDNVFDKICEYDWVDKINSEDGDGSWVRMGGWRDIMV